MCSILKKRFYAEITKSFLNKKALGDTTSHFVYMRMNNWDRGIIYPLMTMYSCPS